MSARKPTERSASRRRIPWIAFVAIAVLLLVGLLSLLRTERITRLALQQIGDTLGLEIAADSSEVRLRGTPTLVVHDLVARAPGVATPLLTAERALLSLPWSTLRARGQELDFTRIELDAPVLDLDALQAWRATRPPGETRVPTLREGLQVDDGAVVGRSWRIEGLDLVLPWLHPQREVHAGASGRYRNGDTTLPFDLRAVLARPASNSALGIAGQTILQRPGWRIPARVRLSGVLQVDDGDWGIARMKLAADARYQRDATQAPFAFGLAAPLRYADGRLTLAPVGIAVRVRESDDSNPIPDLDAHGALALQQVLELQLDGTLAGWPDAWPALPPPLGTSDSPLPFALRYVGAADLSDIADLRLQHDGSRFDGNFRLPAATAWLDEDGRLSPLPPLDGRATVPRMEVAGATLHGVEITIDDPDVQ